MDIINSNIKVENEQILEISLAEANEIPGFPQQVRIKIKSDSELLQNPVKIIERPRKPEAPKTYLINDNDPESILEELPVKETKTRRRIPKKLSDDFWYDFKKGSLKKAQEELSKNFKQDKPTPRKAPVPVKSSCKKSDQKSYEISGALAEDLKAAGFIVTKNSQNRETIATYYPNNFEEFNLMLDKFKQAWTDRQIVQGVNSQFEQLGKGCHEYQTGIKKKVQVKEPEIKLKVTENGVQDIEQLSSEDSESDTENVSEPEAEKGPERPGVPTITIVNPKKIVESEKLKKEEESEIAKKRKGDPENWQKNIKKRKRQSGQEYIDLKGNLVPAKAMLPPCSDQCILNCSKKIAEDARKELFDHFWTLTTYEKRFYCADRVKEIEKKFHSRRMVTRVYHLESSGIWYRVCKNFFCRTLGYQNIDQLLKKKKTTGSLDPLEGN